jgi:SAM-dependent methyltransferase
MNNLGNGDYQALNELEIMAQASNYNSWIWRAILPFIGENVLEIGAGIGTFTDYLKTRRNLYATDIGINCINVLRERFKGFHNIIIEEYDITADPIEKGWIGKQFDTAICLNVLEHIKDDISALQNVKQVLGLKGRIILMVPAFQAVFGTIDKLDGHFRRYSKAELSGKLKEAGFRPQRMHYFNSIGLLAWFYTNKIARDRATSVSKVKVYDKMFVPVLRTLEGIIKPPFGQSLIAIGEKL